MAKDTTFETLKGQLQGLYGEHLGSLDNFTNLKKALRIINGVDTMDLPENLSSSEQDEIVKNSQGTSDAMAYVIERYIKNKLDDVSDEIEEATDDSIEFLADSIVTLT